MRKIFQFASRHPDAVSDKGYTRLQQAILDGDLPRVKKLVEKKARINFRGDILFPPLHMALEHDRQDIALYLLEKGADVNLQDGNGQTPLHKAAAQCQEPFILTLLKLDADPNIADENGDTPLHVISTARPELVDTLIQGGANPNARNKDGNTPLHRFLARGRMVERLLAGKADPNLKNNAGVSPFMAMLDEDYFREYGPLVHEMLKHSADLGSTNKLGETLLLLAARLENIQAFYAAFNDVELARRDHNKNNVMHALVRTMNVTMISRVLSKKPDLLLEENATGATPLGELVKRADRLVFKMDEQFMTVARMMINAGAHPDATDEEGRTLLHHAVAQKQEAFAIFLLQNKINPNVINGDGKAALHVAIDAKNMDMLDILLDNGADPDLIDAKGWTVLDRLAEKGDRDSPVVQRLIVAGGQYNKQLPLYPELMKKKNTALDNLFLDRPLPAGRKNGGKEKELLPPPSANDDSSLDISKPAKKQDGKKPGP